MASDFLQLADISLLITKGTTPSTFGGRFTSAGINFVKSESLSYDGRIDNTKFAFIDRATHEKQKRSQITENDILYSIAGVNLGKCGVATADILPANTNQAVAIIRIDPERANARFVSYVLRDTRFVQKVLRGVAQSAQPNVNLGDISRFSIPSFPLSSQRAIAKVLTDLDQKIELNRRMAETLEAMVLTLFKSWFVSFDPVQPKSDKRSGLSQKVATLFPLSIGKEGLPKGWALRDVSELFDVGIGKTPPRNDPQWFSKNDKDIPWMSIRDLGTCGTYISEVSEYLTQEAVDRFRVRLIPNNTVVLSFKLTVGRVAIAARDMLSNEAIAHFLARSGTYISSEYLFCFLKSFNFESLGSTSSIASAVNSESIREIKIIEPDKKVHDAFFSIAQPCFLRIRQLQEEARTVTTLRDALLPRLISGELRINDVEKRIVAA